MLPTFRDRWAISVWAYTDDSAKPSSPYPGWEQSPPFSVPRGMRSGVCDRPLAALPAEPAPQSGPPPLQPRHGADWSTHARDATIFVSIAAYRDSELRHTVRSLLRTAQSPHRVYVGVVNQTAAGDEDCGLGAEAIADCFSGAADPEQYFARHVQVLTVPHCRARGPLYARSLAAGLYRGEEYVLQVDSHMRFRMHWDAYLVDTLELARDREGCPKPVLTAYPQGYQLPDLVPTDTRPTLLVSITSKYLLSVTAATAPIGLFLLSPGRCPVGSTSTASCGRTAGSSTPHLSPLVQQRQATTAVGPWG